MFAKYPGAIHIIGGIFFLFSCSTPKQVQHMANKGIGGSVISDSSVQANFLENLLKKYPEYFDQVLRNRQEWNVQVIYTEIDRKKDGTVKLRDHYFNVDRSRYFYPASTVKLPVVLLALQKLNELAKKGLDKYSTMITESLPGVQPAVFNDPTAPDGRPAIANYIRKILMVSDNDAFNRLYEFLGQEYINDQLHKKGYPDAQILHRLNVFLSDKQNRQTNAVWFPDSNNTLLYTQPQQQNLVTYPSRNDFIGKGFYSGGQLVNRPMDFSKKNRIGLEDLHHIMTGLFFPGTVKQDQRFNLTDDDKRFVFKYMSQYPTESIFPPYAADTSYWPAFGKFLLFGAGKGKMPDHIRIFNKEGDAYGHMLDVAYIVDFKNHIEFFLSAVIYCNSDGILNDDKYDYASIGLPFMKHLGEVIYDYELKRERKIKPDLSGLMFKYDK